MTSASRPPALHVPVTDVVTRTSLVTPVPPRGSSSEFPPGVAVVQRAVRYISDAPPPMAQIGASHGASEPSVTIESGTPPGFVTGSLAGSDEPDFVASLKNAISDSAEHAPPEPLLGDEPFTDQVQQAHAFAEQLDDEDDAPDGSDDPYASMEVEQLELADELSDELGDDGDEFGEEPTEPEEEESEIEFSMPPPAPPQALRRPSNEPGAHESHERGASGEFEELDVETDERPELAGGSRSLAPPPPPGRLSMPEGPDLSSLARSARIQELRPSRPRPHAWWEVFFDDDYLRTVRPPTREQISRQCDFIEQRLALKPGATLLDVCCGLGLHVLELASRGYLGVGLDLSLPMLSRASEEAQSRSLRVNFLHSDMREMSFEGAFDAVLCLGTSLGYFDEDTNRKILERLYRALKPGGLLLLDLVNRDHVIRSQPNLIWFEGDGCVCMEESEFNFFTSRLHIKRTVILDSGRQTENEYSLRLYSLHELGQLLNGIGFRVKEVSGRDALPGVFFGQESPNLVIVAERRLNSPDGAEERPNG